MERPKDTLKPLGIAVFRPLLAAILINTVGDVFGLVALSVLVFDETHSAVALMMLFVVKEFAPALITPLLASKLEGLRPRLSFGGLYLANAAIYVLLALIAQDFVLGVIFVLAFVDGALTLTARSLVKGTTATVLKAQGQLRAGNALINNIFTMSHGFGPLAAGLVVAGFGVSGALLVDAASFVVAGGVLAATRGLHRLTVPTSWSGHLREGLAYIGREPALKLLLGTSAALLVFLTAVLPIEVALVKATFGRGDADFGLFLALWGVGMAVGGLAFTMLRRVSLAALIIIGSLVEGAAYMGVGLAPFFFLAAAVNLIGGIGNGVQLPAILTALQHRAPDAYQIRVAAVNESISFAMPGAGYAIGGALAAAFSPRVAFVVAGLGVVAVISVLGPRLRRAADESAAAEEGVAIEGSAVSQTGEARVLKR